MSEKFSTTKTLPIGSISSGTLKEMSLIHAFMSALEEVDSDRYFQVRDDEWRTLLEACNEYGDDEMMDIEGARNDAAMLLDRLHDILNEYVPDYCYFGSNPGDGADFGVWIDEDVLQGGIDDHEIMVTDETPDFPIDARHSWLDDQYSYALVVNDHGNRTLYTAQGTVVWEVV